MPTHTTIPPVEATAKAVDALLTELAATPTVGVGIAFRAAIVRHGRNLLATTGPEALPAALSTIRADVPDKAAADEREAIVTQTWNALSQDQAV